MSRGTGCSRPEGSRAGGWSWAGGMFLTGQAVSLLGDGLAVLAIPLVVLGLTRNPLASAVSAGTVTVAYLLVGLPAGVLIDRLDPWRVLIAADAARALLFAVLFGLSAAGVLAVWLVLLIGLAAGACSVFFSTALVVVVRELFTAAGLLRANSVIELASQAGWWRGPAVVAGTIVVAAAAAGWFGGLRAGHRP